MLTEPLSGRRDLVEGLDAEAIFDYLTHHGVLQSPVMQQLRGTSSVTQRNATLLQHVEGEGHNAVALFINALRQSGQLHLASSLDNTQRIKPLSQGGYLEKLHHKGEVTIMIKVQALLLVVPERDSEGDVIDASMLASPDPHTSRRLHQSYENMLMLEDEPDHLSRRITEYSYATDDEEEHPRKKSFFCFCFSSRRKKAKEKKYVDQQEMKQRNSKVKGGGEGGEEAGEHKGSNGAKSSTQPRLQDTNNSRLHGNGDSVDAPLGGDAKRNSGSPRKDTSVEQGGGRKVVNGRGRGKENQDPVVMEYNKQMELVRLKAQKHGHTASPKSRSSAIIMCEKWKSGGQYFRKKVTALCQQFEFDLQTYVIKYVEQERGTLVLSIWTEGESMLVSTICMTLDQLRQLQADYTSGALTERVDALLRTNQCLHKLDIKDMKLDVVIQDDQLRQAQQELA
ncbi:hypothetical protein V1264_007541 [Littorina saxatilis]|uniref:CARD domain-containing protein n=2 Tax=Littorina saxatilis TaxID=31220 RepID=A0AAN9AV16_9CAEN